MSGNGRLRPCEVKISLNRKRPVAAIISAPFNKNPEPLPVQIKRKNCPYLYKKSDVDSDPAEASLNECPEPIAATSYINEDSNNCSNGRSSNVYDEMARMYPDLSAANLQTLVKNASSAAGRLPAEESRPKFIEKSHIPNDWSLKNSLMITLSLFDDDNDFLGQVRKCSDSDAMARAITSFVDIYSPPISKIDKESSLSPVLSAIRAASKMWCLSSISLLTNGSVSKYANTNFENNRLPASEQVSLIDGIVKEQNAKWLTALLSLFNLTKLQICPYFYIMDARITALIGYGKDDAPGEFNDGNPFSKLVASIAPAPTGLLSWLRNSKITFSAINEFGAEIENTDGSIIPDSEEMDFQKENEEENKNVGDESDSLSYFEELGVASMILENLKADGKVKEITKQPQARAVLIKGRSVLTFVNLLVETRGFPDRSVPAATELKRNPTKSDIGNGSRFPLPALISPVTFDCASLSSFRVRVSANSNSEVGSLAIQITGGLPLPPFVVHRVFSILIASNRQFTARPETWQLKSQADYLNSTLSSVGLSSPNDLTSISSVVDEGCAPKTLPNISFANGFFSLPVSH